MAKTTISQRITNVENDIAYRNKRLKFLKERLANVTAQRENLAKLFIQPLSTKQKRSGTEARRKNLYEHLNTRIAKLNFEILVIEGGTIPDQTTADWISDNKWGFQSLGNVREDGVFQQRRFEVGDKFNLDYGKEFGGKDSRFYNIYEGQDQHGLYDSGLEKLESKLEMLKITASRNEKEVEYPPKGDKFVFVDSQSNLVKPYSEGSTRMLESDYLRGTNLNPDSEIEAAADNLMQSLSIKQNAANLDKTLTNGTK